MGELFLGISCLPNIFLVPSLQKMFSELFEIGLEMVRKINWTFSSVFFFLMLVMLLMLSLDVLSIAFDAFIATNHRQV